MMITKDTRFSALKAFVHWWLLGVAGLLPAAWLADTMPTRELQALCYGAGLVWCMLAAWIIGRCGERYTKRVVPMAATATATTAHDQVVGCIEDGTWFGSFDEQAGYSVTYD